jgi:hypothetical protein
MNLQLDRSQLRNTSPAKRREEFVMRSKGRNPYITAAGHRQGHILLSPATRYYPLAAIQIYYPSRAIILRYPHSIATFVQCPLQQVSRLKLDAQWQVMVAPEGRLAKNIGGSNSNIEITTRKLELIVQDERILLMRQGPGVFLSRDLYHVTLCPHREVGLLQTGQGETKWAAHDDPNTKRWEAHLG